MCERKKTNKEELGTMQEPEAEDLGEDDLSHFAVNPSMASAPPCSTKPLSNPYDYETEFSSSNGEALANGGIGGCANLLGSERLET